MKKDIVVLQLYPRDMNIYGDWGNSLVIKRRLQWHGYNPILLEYNQGDEFPSGVDIVVGGGGQDSGQSLIHNDLLGIKDPLLALAKAGTPMLAICGLYQLFGHSFTMLDGSKLRGIGLFDMETRGDNERLIGNVTVQSPDFGTIIAYENHSGKTFLGKNLKPLGQVRKGAGNNGKDDTEGARLNNVIGCYLHGSLLPKNPQIADFLIEQAVIKKYGEFEPSIIDDHFAQKARAIALKPVSYTH